MAIASIHSFASLSHIYHLSMQDSSSRQGASENYAVLPSLWVRFHYRKPIDTRPLHEIEAANGGDGASSLSVRATGFLERPVWIRGGRIDVALLCCWFGVKRVYLCTNNQEATAEDIALEVETEGGRWSALANFAQLEGQRLHVHGGLDSFEEALYHGDLHGAHHMAADKMPRHSAGCDECGSPISGLRYQCLECTGIDLCYACMHYRREGRTRSNVVCDLHDKSSVPSDDSTREAERLEHEYFRGVLVDAELPQRVGYQHRHVFAPCVQAAGVDLLRRNSLVETLLGIFQRFALRPVLSQRTCLEHAMVAGFDTQHAAASVDDNDDAAASLSSSASRWGDFEALTYNQLLERAMRFGSSLDALIPYTSGTDRSVALPLRYLAICGENSVDWLVALLGCMLYGIVAVPLHKTLERLGVEHVMRLCDIRVVACDAKRAPMFISMARDGGFPIATLVLLERAEISAANRTLVGDAIGHLTTVSQLELSQSLAALRVPVVYGPPTIDAPLRRVPCSNGNAVDGARLVLLSFTSGSTGLPKGAMIDESMLVSDFHMMLGSAAITPQHYVSLEVMPLAFGSARQHFLNNCCFGGHEFLMSRNKAYLLDELCAVQPTVMAGVPSLWTVFYSQFEDELQRKMAGITTKRYRDRLEVRQVVETKYRTMFGNRLHTLVTGGAATSGAVLDFLRTIFKKTNVVDSYGATEVGSIATDGQLATEHGAQYRLRDVPEMGYLSTDRPYPRGELCVRSRNIISGYFKDDGATKDNFDGDGWYRTGDVVEMLSADRVRVIDRIKNFFKLGSGEFVSPTRLEELYLEAPSVGQIHVTGKPTSSAVVAIVVPSSCMSKQRAIDQPHDASGTSTDASAILIELQQVARKHSLRQFEIPCAVHVSQTEFTPENGLLTATGKPCRHAVERRFAAEIVALYEQLQAAKSEPAPQGCSPLVALLAGILGSAAVSAPGGALRIESLNAMRIVAALRERYQTDIPVDLVLGVKSIEQLEQVVASLTSGDPRDSLQQAPATASVASAVPQVDAVPVGAAVLEEVEVQFERDRRDLSWISKWRTAAASSLTPPEASLLTQSRGILLTGSTGFVGIHLLHQLLLDTHATIYCLIRGEGPCTRLREYIRECRLETYQPMADILAGVQRHDGSTLPDGIERASERVLVVHGDLAERLGLSEVAYAYLDHHVDAVVHNAAYVNWVAPYVGAMRESNFIGTAHVLDFCLHTGGTARPSKYCHYISTVSVGGDGDDAPSPQSTRSGYVLSKYLAEQLVKRAAAGCSLHAQIYRVGAVSGHSRTGAANPTDYVNRFMKACLELGAYPTSNGRLELIPVDYVAAAIVTLGSRIECERRSSMVPYVFTIENVANAIVYERLGQLLSAVAVDTLKNKEALQPLSTEAFVELVRTHGEQHLQAGRANALFPLFPMLQNDGFWRSSAAYSNMVKSDQQLGEGTRDRGMSLIHRYVLTNDGCDVIAILDDAGVVHPEITAELIACYARFLTSL